MTDQAARKGYGGRGDLGSYLPPGLPAPAPSVDGLAAEYWEAARRHELVVQRCRRCRTWQWGPEHICHHCHAFDLAYEQVAPWGRIYSWERSWYPVHPALAAAVPYLTVLVELPQAGGVRMVGNLLGDPLQAASIGAEVEAVFEDHDDGDPPFTLVQWRVAKLPGRGPILERGEGGPGRVAQR